MPPEVHQCGEEQFLAMMTKHHASAVHMSKLAKGNTTRPELLQFAQKVVKDQSHEMQVMKGWQQAWFNK